MGRNLPPANHQGRAEQQTTQALLALPLLALLAYLAAMIPFALFLAQGWDVLAFLEPVAVVLIFNGLVGRYFP